ncbi:MAG: hypothetical protein ACK5B9_15680 [Flavobacteriia bacterium]
MAVFLTNSVLGQNSETCEKIVSQIYDGINKQQADHLITHLSKDFSVAGYSGEIALQIFPVYITSIKEKVSNIKKHTAKQTNVLTLVYEAQFGDNEINKSTFVFDKNNKLIKMDLLPTQVIEQ